MQDKKPSESGKKENTSKIYKLKKRIRIQKDEIRKLKAPKRKMTKIKFIGVPFDPREVKSGEAEINEALADGFEVMRDFLTAGGIVMTLGKWKIGDKNGIAK